MNIEKSQNHELRDQNRNPVEIFRSRCHQHVEHTAGRTKSNFPLCSQSLTQLKQNTPQALGSISHMELIPLHCSRDSFEVEGFKLNMPGRCKYCRGAARPGAVVLRRAANGEHRGSCETRDSLPAGLSSAAQLSWFPTVRSEFGSSCSQR